MQIVINISVDTFCDLKKKQNRTEVDNVVLNGIPLPKGHGGLVDYEELKNNAREYGVYTEAVISHVKPKIIIEADVSESKE